MKSELVERIFEGIPGVRKEASSYRFSDEHAVSVYISVPSEVLQVQRVVRVERGGELTTLESHGGDRYTVATDSIAMVKIGAPEKRAPGAGFR